MVKYIKADKMELSAERALQRSKNFDKINSYGQLDLLMDSIYMYYIRKDEIPELLKRYNKWVEKVKDSDDIFTQAGVQSLRRPLETFTEEEIYRYM